MQKKKTQVDTTARAYLAKIGSTGGKARAAEYNKETLSKWARLGGRPPKSKEKRS